MKAILIKVPLLLILFIGLAFAASAQDVGGVYVYPEENQSEEQQARDENACYAWAQEEVAEHETPTEEPTDHKTLKDAGKGAAAGAIIGIITGDPIEGAVIGGGAGAVRGHRKSGKTEEAAQAQASEDFKSAYSACLKAKGYSVE